MLLMVSAIAGNIYGITANHVDVFRVVPETALVVGVLCLAGPFSGLEVVRRTTHPQDPLQRTAPRTGSRPRGSRRAGRASVVRVKGGWAPGSAY
ncbi:hypothetical protein [Streptomyces sp. NPDC058678]|uniref:hypothetical protein n=1 Tax=Streptomyces sp. NPDC058678 TaxID=3346595 RepID=UPI003667642B